MNKEQLLAKRKLWLGVNPIIVKDIDRQLAELGADVKVEAKPLSLDGKLDEKVKKPKPKKKLFGFSKKK